MKRLKPDMPIVLFSSDDAIPEPALNVVDASFRGTKRPTAYCRRSLGSAVNIPPISNKPLSRPELGHIRSYSSSSVVLCALRRRALLHLGSNKVRIFRFALCSCDFELPTVQSSSSAISSCW
jgi:hypothetical protein